MISIKDNVTLPDDTRCIELQVSRPGVRVVLDDLHSPGYNTIVVTLAWDQLEDVELLAARFGTETVRVFRQLVIMLGKVHANRALYGALV